MRDSIQEILANFKRLLSDDAFFYATLVVLISIASFGFGRWSVLDRGFVPAQDASPIKAQTGNYLQATGTERTLQSKPTVQATSTGNTQYVASKNGTKFHLLWCPGAKQIKEENKIYFDSKEEAQKAGYAPASNCKGI